MKKRFINERGLIFGKVSIVDIVAVLVVLALGFMVFTRFFAGGEEKVSSTDTVDVTYAMRLEAVRSVTADALAAGDRVYSDEGQYMGEIVSVETSVSVTLEETPDGRVVEMENEGYVDALVTLKAPCSESSGRYFVNGNFELNVNSRVKFVTRYVSSSALIVSIG